MDRNLPVTAPTTSSFPTGDAETIPTGDAETIPPGDAETTRQHRPGRLRSRSFGGRIIRAVKGLFMPNRAQGPSRPQRDRPSSDPVGQTGKQGQAQQAVVERTLSLRAVSVQAKLLDSHVSSSSSSPEPLAIAGRRERSGSAMVREELNRACRVAVLSGFVKGIIDTGHPACKSPVSDAVFKEIVFAFNDVMGGLFQRFPGISRIEPPMLSRNDPLKVSGHRDYACYQTTVGAMSFGEWPPHSDWPGKCSADNFPRPAQGTKFEDVVAHQFGHHICSERVVRESCWVPKLARMLREHRQEFLSQATSPRAGSSTGGASFAETLGELVEEIDVTTPRARPRYATQPMREFAAETIAWRLRGDYGRSTTAPRMPPALESWTYRCFPLLNNGEKIELPPSYGLVEAETHAPASRPKPAETMV